MADVPEIYKLRVKIRATRPVVWRRLLVTDDLTLYELHEVLQIAFGWRDGYSHDFEIRNPGFLHEDAVRLRDLGPGRLAEFLYTYNFGTWECEIKLEQVRPAKDHSEFPMCTAGRRAAPPENCRYHQDFKDWKTAYQFNFPHDTLQFVVEALEPLVDMRVESNNVRDMMDMDRLRQAKDELDAYAARDPEKFDSEPVNDALRAWAEERRSWNLPDHR